MRAPFEVLHPDDGTTFFRPWFVAYGKGRASTEVTGELVDQDGNPVGKVTPLVRTKRVWALLVSDIVLGNQYTLQILDAASGEQLGEVDDLALELDHGFIGIDYPKDGDLPVDVNFLVYGPTNEPGPLTAALDPPDAAQITLIFGPPGNPRHYCFEYDNVTPGSYDPGVTITGSGSPTTQHVDVQAM